MDCFRGAAPETTHWRKLHSPHLEILPSQARPGPACVLPRLCEAQVRTCPYAVYPLEEAMKSLFFACSFSVWLIAVLFTCSAHAQMPGRSDGLAQFEALFAAPAHRIPARHSRSTRLNELRWPRIPRSKLLSGASLLPRRMFPLPARSTILRPCIADGACRSRSPGTTTTRKTCSA